LLFDFLVEDVPSRDIFVKFFFYCEVVIDSLSSPCMRLCKEKKSISPVGKLTKAKKVELAE
jgi:hypothetical protein